MGTEQQQEFKSEKPLTKPQRKTIPFTDISIMGEKTEFENLSISFIVDEYLENYISLHNWLTGIGFPKSRSQFSTFRDTTSKTPDSQKGVSTDIGNVKQSTPDKAMYSDAFIMILY